jgi:phosphoglycerate dehydrogenase-like enzyme
VRLTTSSGANAVPIAQTVLLYLLALSRDLARWQDAQQRRAWETHEVVDLQGLTLGVVGLGPIGLEVARLGAALRMRVVGVRRSPRGDEPCETWPIARPTRCCSRRCAAGAAADDDTHHLFDARRIALVNAAPDRERGRGASRRLRHRCIASGRSAPASTCSVEPLPPRPPDDKIVTPHNSGDSRGNQVRAAEIVLDNLARFGRGEALRNEVA